MLPGPLHHDPLVPRKIRCPTCGQRLEFLPESGRCYRCGGELGPVAGRGIGRMRGLWRLLFVIGLFIALLVGIGYFLPPLFSP